MGIPLNTPLVENLTFIVVRKFLIFIIKSVIYINKILLPKEYGGLRAIASPVRLFDRYQFHTPIQRYLALLLTMSIYQESRKVPPDEASDRLCYSSEGFVPLLMGTRPALETNRDWRTDTANVGAA